MSPTEDDPRSRLFAEHRSYLFAVAYRLLGSAEDAEDVVQDAWLRFSGVAVDDLVQPRAYLVTVVTRLAIDLLRSARRRREEYVGVWLPEPVVSAEALPSELAEQAESASFAFLLLLERLNPVERAVLVLHDVFDYSHDEIAEAIDRSSAASRQALRRARQKLGELPRPASEPTAHGQRLVGQFLEASRTGDVEALMGTLAADVVLMSDGGGRVRAASRPIAGGERVGKFLVAMGRMAEAEIRLQTATLNGQPSMLILEDDVLTNAFLFDTTAAGVTAIYVVRNPEKLQRLSAAYSGR